MSTQNIQQSFRDTVAMMTAIDGFPSRGLVGDMDDRRRAADLCDGWCLDAPSVIPAGSVSRSRWTACVESSLVTR
jgi:hypothetical protein